MPKKKRERLAFHVPAELRDRAEAMIRTVRADPTPKAHADELIELIVELTHTGLHSYFLAPLERVEVGTLAMGTAKLGVGAAGKSLPTIVRRILGKMSDDQLREIVDILDEMLI
jgi:hypothetical protein